MNSRFSPTRSVSLELRIIASLGLPPQVVFVLKAYRVVELVDALEVVDVVKVLGGRGVRGGCKRSGG